MSDIYTWFIESSPALIIAIPLLFAFGTPLVSKINKMLRNIWVMLGVVLTAGLTYVMAFEVLKDGGGPFNTIVYIFGAGENGSVDGTAFDALQNVRITFFVDGMAVFMGLIMVTVALAAIIYSFGFIKKYSGQDKYFSLLLLLLAANLGMVFTGDVFNLFVWFEVSSVAICGLVAFRSNRGESFEGAAKYLIYSTVAGLLFLFAIGLLYGQYGHLNIKYLGSAIGGDGSLILVDKIVLGIIVSVFALKAGAVPVHMATPDAYSEAPAPITAMMVTASQAGLYALFRTCFTMYGDNIYDMAGNLRAPDMLELVHGAGYIMVVLGVISMFVGVTLALVQKDIKRLMAYHAISQTGYMLLGVGIGLAVYSMGGTSAFADFGRTAMSGGIFHIFNHALYKGLLFLTAGAIIYKAGTRDLNKMGGLGRNMKLTALFFIIGALAISGIPPANGFASKLLIYEAAFKFNPLIGAVAMMVSLLTLASFVKVFYSAFMGPKNPEMKQGEVPRSMLIGMAVLAGVILVFSFAPSLVIGSIVDPAVTALSGVGPTITYPGIADQPIAAFTMLTGQGGWNALMFLVVIIVTLIIALVIRMLGNKGTTPGGEGGKPYLFGNPTEVDGKPIVISSSNLYWGFVRALKKYYDPMKKAHSGVINEYVFWFVATAGIVILVLTFL
ncbi:MAG: proton-conducting transporter membrane subunit [Candidatus Thermoplasmatota archaeon]|nr:proton-conducting transporter membrane subunit [Candidatus Thermoplasmatota archaeon]